MDYGKQMKKLVRAVVSTVESFAAIAKRAATARQGRVALGPISVEFDDNCYETDPDGPSDKTE